MTTTVRVETSQKAAVVQVTGNPDIKIEPYDAGTFHIHDENEITVREARDENIAKPEDPAVEEASAA
jgi:hypothetical protein